MGVVPFEFTNNETRKTLNINGNEKISIHCLEVVKPLQEVDCQILKPDNTTLAIKLKCRIDTAIEKEYIEHGGVLQYVLRSLAS